MAKKARTRNPEQTRGALLEAASDEFARYGFDGARVERIVRNAGCNMRMLYHYFQSKENLYLEVLENVYRDIRQREHGLDLETLSPLDAILRLTRFTWAHISANRLFIDIARNENLVGGKFIRRSEAISEMSSPLIRQIDDVIARGVSAGVFRHDVDGLQLYISIVALSSHHLANVHTLSAVFRTDLGNEDWLHARRIHVEEMVLRTLGVDDGGHS
ncbi:MAG: TetR/AcrR family transcriptional regulator [Rhodospirillales bacterium]